MEKPDFIKDLGNDDYEVDAIIDFDGDIWRNTTLCTIILRLFDLSKKLYRLCKDHLSKEERRKIDKEFDTIEYLMAQHL